MIELHLDAMAIDGFVRLHQDKFNGDQLLSSKLIAVLTVEEADALVKSLSDAIHSASLQKPKPEEES